MKSASDESDSPAIVDRPGQRRGFLHTAWPIIAMALILLLLVRACVPAMQGAPAPPPAVGSGAAR